MTAPDTTTNFIEIARQLAELGQTEKALQAYTLALKQETTSAVDRFEAACALLQYGEDYTVAYDAFLSLYQEAACRADALSILTDAFYLPNEEQMQQQYAANCALLERYPYLFRKDFLAFEELPVRFYPYDDNGVIPYNTEQESFGQYTNFNEPIVHHYFFRDLTKPVLAEGVFSQYELEYLKDNVRRSDWVGCENHIYLHYPDWNVFCAHLQILDFGPLLEDQKFVFLIGDEISQYPIDFKERFGVDYSQYRPKRLGIREVNKLIWHTQLHSHNGGDFFNEILHGHPYLLVETTAMFKDMLESFTNIINSAEIIAKRKKANRWDNLNFKIMDEYVLRDLVELKDRTLKDAMVAYYLGQKRFTRHLDPNSRIVPAIICQPHFPHMKFFWNLHETGRIVPECSAYSELKESGLFQQFKYIKTFTPMRRATTSHAASMRFMQVQIDQQHTASASSAAEQADKPIILPDVYFDRILNRSFMVDSSDRLLCDSRIVRFEDGKLNPTATFTALAEFMDVPYTETMTYCSDERGKDPVFADNAVGFDPAPVYRTYDEFADEHERALMEYLCRDVYEQYGYGFRYYDGKPMTQEGIEALLDQCRTSEELTRRSWRASRDKIGKKHNLSGEALDAKIKELEDTTIARYREARLLALRIIKHGLNFCNQDGYPLHLMEPLKLDPALLQTELYR